MNEDFNYDAYAENIFQRILKHNPKIRSMGNPVGIVLGGQPGSGKSNLIHEKEKVFDDNLFVISGDDYRKYHPYYVLLQEKYGKDSVDYTAKFAGKMTELLIGKAIENKFNVIIEGTFRTSNVPIFTLDKLKQNGYTTSVMVQICDKDLSWKSCLERYNKMYEANPLEARYTKKEHHDKVVKAISKSIIDVFNSGKCDSFEIYERSYSKKVTKIFDSKESQIIKQSVIDKKLGLSKDRNIEYYSYEM